MDTAIIVAVISGAVTIIVNFMNMINTNKRNKETKEEVNKTNEHITATEYELKKQGELLAKTERAFQERKRHEELQNEISMANLTSTQVILESLHREGRVNGDCERQRNELNKLKDKMASQALHLHDDDIKY